MEQKTTKTLFSLLSTVDGKSHFDADTSYSNEQLNEFFALAKKHDLAHVLAYALYENGIVKEDSALYLQVQREQIQAIWRYEQTQLVLDELKELFENERIEFVPLKGSVIRSYYKEPWLRTSCDIDILIRESELEHAEALLTERGWTKKGRNFHDVSFFSPTNVHLELHYNITEQIANIDRVLNTVWEHCESVDGKSCEKRQTPEFLMYHLLAHMSYHFISGGCGIRPFLDIWLLRKALEYNEQELDALCEQAELTVFKKNVYQLIDVWLEGKEHTELTLSMERFLFGGGVYGTISNRVILEQAQAGGKAKNLIYRLFLPYHLLKRRYPVLKKHKWLTPVFWVVRWFQSLSKERIERSVCEIKENAENSSEDIKSAERFLAAVGLNPKDR